MGKGRGKVVNVKTQSIKSEELVFRKRKPFTERRFRKLPEKGKRQMKKKNKIIFVEPEGGEEEEEKQPRRVFHHRR